MVKKPNCPYLQKSRGKLKGKGVVGETFEDQCCYNIRPKMICPSDIIVINDDAMLQENCCHIFLKAGSRRGR